MSIQFVTDLATIGDRPDLDAIPGGEFARGLPKILTDDIVKPALRDAIREMTEFLNSIDAGNGRFQIDQAEMTFTVQQSGKVTVFLADVGGAISGGVRIQWKRNESAGRGGLEPR